MTTTATRRYDGTDPGLSDGWIHDDGTQCPGHLARADGTRWWCTEHQRHLKRPAADPGPCELCGGYCTNGAECAVSQFVGKPRDWRDGNTAVRSPGTEIGKGSEQ